MNEVRIVDGEVIRIPPTPAVQHQQRMDMIDAVRQYSANTMHVKDAKDALHQHYDEFNFRVWWSTFCEQNMLNVDSEEVQYQMEIAHAAWIAGQSSSTGSRT